MQELVKVNLNSAGEQVVSARDLWAFLEVKEKITDWIKRMFEYGFVENSDYYIIYEKKATNNPKNPYTTFADYALTLNTAKEISMAHRTEKSRLAYKFFIEKMENREVVIVNQPRKEYQFKELLFRFFGKENIECQIKVCEGKYIIDFVVYGLVIVEYDEKHHQYSTEKDKQRMFEIVQWYNEHIGEENYKPPVVRVQEGFEIEGLSDINDILIGWEFFSNWDHKVKKFKTTFLRYDD